VPTEGDGPVELAVYSGKGVVVYPLLAGKPLVIGRAEGVDIRVDAAGVSRRHARFHLGPPLEVEDLESSNGTFVSSSSSGERETASQSRVKAAKAALRLGDSVFIGGAVVVARAARAEPPPSKWEADGAVVRDPSTIRVYSEAWRAAPMPIPVLIAGETGSGKELLARFVHRESAKARANGPFVALNCAALSESLVDAQLFGHEKGAFTGAVQARPGVFESAHGGTLFLDEIGELPLATQAKLLRTLENSEVHRLGGAKPITVDVRLVSASNRDLEQESARGAFRADLYFRVNGITLRLPPLRQRKVEIAVLARRFLEEASKPLGLAEAPALTPEALEALEAYAWPGNVRELRYMMARVLVACGAGPVLLEHLPPEVQQSQAARAPHKGEAARDGLATREAVVEALRAEGDNQTRAAERLGISRRTLINRMIEFDLPRPRKR
jgi:DNA-binding NtrC family response regulator